MWDDGSSGGLSFGVADVGIDYRRFNKEHYAVPSRSVVDVLEWSLASYDEGFPS
jgi:hypothetical protein